MGVRGLLVVNPRATTTSSRVVDVIVHALSDEIDLEVTVTTHQGHAVLLGERAREQKLDIVVTLGGDGVINEVVNGILAEGPGPDVPMLAPVPGGSANVFARSLGLPKDTVEATGMLLDSLRTGDSRLIGIGTANDRWFLANAGLGIDAEVIAAMEGHREQGRAATPMRYLMTTLNTYFRGTDRRHPALTITAPGSEQPEPTEISGVFLAFVQNTSPWTYLGNHPITPCPDASFDAALDLFALRRMGIPTSLVAAGRLLSGSERIRARDGIVAWHDRGEFTITASRPVAFQIDGEGMGETTSVRFRHHPDAIRVVC